MDMDIETARGLIYLELWLIRGYFAIRFFYDFWFLRNPSRGIADLIIGIGLWLYSKILFRLWNDEEKIEVIKV